VILVAQPFGGGDECGDHLVIRGGRVVLAHVLVAGPLLADCAGRDHQVADGHLGLDRTAGADPDERLDADSSQFLDGDRSGGAADAGRGDRDGRSVGLTRRRSVLAVVGPHLVVVPERDDLLEALGVSRRSTVSATSSGPTSR